MMTASYPLPRGRSLGLYWSIGPDRRTQHRTAKRELDCQTRSHVPGSHAANEIPDGCGDTRSLTSMLTPTRRRLRFQAIALPDTSCIYYKEFSGRCSSNFLSAIKNPVDRYPSGPRLRFLYCQNRTGGRPAPDAHSISNSDTQSRRCDSRHRQGIADV